MIQDHRAEAGQNGSSHIHAHTTFFTARRELVKIYMAAIYII
jgi:hypothetical protein